MTAPTEGTAPTTPTPPGRHALLVVAHPRPDSLTAATARRARERLEAAGYTVDVLDLHAEDFDPRMTPADEPDWAHRDKTYSPEVRAHMDRVTAADLITMVFPLWWFGLPAILKGWIDRVWNYGFAYGRSRPHLAGKRMLWLTLVSYHEQEFSDLGWAQRVEHTLRSGISEFCGIEDATVHFVYDSLNAGESAVKQAAVAVDALTA